VCPLIANPSPRSKKKQNPKKILADCGPSIANSRNPGRTKIVEQLSQLPRPLDARDFDECPQSFPTQSYFACAVRRFLRVRAALSSLFSDNPDNTNNTILIIVAPPWPVAEAFCHRRESV
jgi:hypothetical protein